MDKVFFVLDDIYSDTLTNIDGTPLSNPILPVDWVYANQPGDWWLEKGARGTVVLCTNLNEFANMVITVYSGAIGSYDINATSNFIGSRPDDSVRK